MKRHAETSAAAVNGLLVLLAGPLVYTLLSTGVPASAVLRTAAVTAPFAALAAWRTWAYAQRWWDQHDAGWNAVLEAGACGLMIALAYLVPGMVRRPADVARYVIFYGGVALVAGLALGLLLRTTAVVVLKLYKLAAG